MSWKLYYLKYFISILLVFLYTQVYFYDNMPKIAKK